jgi:hypothetical protein
MKEMGLKISGPSVTSEDRIKRMNSGWMIGKNNGIVKIEFPGKKEQKIIE